MESPTKESIRDVALLLVKTVECPICLDILNDPVATSCHHRFCRVCIEKALSKKYKIPCPLCNAVVTKRSLNKSKKFAEIVEKVKRLSDAFRQDTGLDVTPQRGPRTTTVDSPEARSLEIFNLLHPSPLKTRSSRAALAARTKEAPSRKRRAVSESSTGDAAKPSKQIRSGEDLPDGRAGGSGQTAQNTFKAPARATSSVMTIEEDVASETSTTKRSLRNATRPHSSSSLSSCSANEVLLHREDNDDLDETASQKTQSEGPIPVRLSTANKKDYTRRSASVITIPVSSTEKVSNWLQDHLDATPKSLQRQSECSTAKQSTGRIFTMKPLGKAGSPGGRRKFLEVSDSDPYKFIPSQTTMKKTRKSKRKLSTKRKSAQRSNKLGRTSMISEEEDLEHMKGQKEKVIVDPSELEVELFVTPAMGPQQSEDSDDVFLPPKKEKRKKPVSVAARRPKTLKDYLMSDVAEKEAKKLQKMITEAESFNLNISKSPPRKERRLQGKELVVVLKDVSNLKAVPAQNFQPTPIPMSPLRRFNSGAPRESAFSIPDTEGKKNAEECLKANSESMDSVICLEEECLPTPERETMQMIENKGTGGNPSIDPVVKDNDTASEPPQTEVSENAVAAPELDVCTMFKRPLRKTFDVSAETQDLQPLAATDVNTLDFMNEVCNNINRHAVYSETDRYVNAGENHSKDGVDMQNLKELLHPEKEQENKTDMNEDGTTAEENVKFTSKFTTEDRGIMTSQPLMESTECCPHCSAVFVVSYKEGKIFVTFVQQARKPVLVESGMCTEKPGTRVIICKEAVTQTEEQTVAKQSCAIQLPCNLESTSASIMTREETPADGIPRRDASESRRTPDVQYAGNNSSSILPQQNHEGISSSAGELNQRHECSSAEKKGGQEAHLNSNDIPQDCGNSGSQGGKDTSSFHKIDNLSSQEGYETSYTPNSVPQHCMDHGLSQAQQNTRKLHHTSRNLMEEPDWTAVPTVLQAQEGMAAQHQDIADIESDAMIRESDILCRETQDHAVSLQEKHCRPDLVPIVEDTEESDGASISSSPNCNVVEANNGVTKNHEDCVRTSERKDTDDCHETTISDLPDVGGCLNGSDKNQNFVGSVVSTTQLSSQNACRTADGQRKASEGPRATQVDDLELSVDMGQDTWHTEEVGERKKSETVIEISSPHSHAAASGPAKAAVHSAGTGGQTPVNYSGAERLHERSPNWSPPIALPKRRRSGMSLFGSSGWQKAESSEETAEDRAEKPKKSTGRKKSQGEKRKSSQGGKEKSGRFKKLIVDLESSDEESPILVDPITESEANEILQHALANDEDSPDEAALNFAKKAVAPLKRSNVVDPWTENLTGGAKLSGTKELQRTSNHQAGLSAASTVRNGRTRRSQLSRTPVESFVGDEGSENIESRIGTTASTLSCLVDRTLKEKQLEQDIEEMKKQMLMLENELQQAAAMDEGTNDTIDIPSNIDEAVFDENSSEKKDAKQSGTVTGIRGKRCAAAADKEDTTGDRHTDDDDDDDDFPESDEDLLLDLVPPTPPRKGVLRKELSFQRERLH